MTDQARDRLLAAIEATLGQGARTYRVHVPFTAGADIGWLYDHAEIVATDASDASGTNDEGRVDPRYAGVFTERFAGRIADGSH